MSGSSSFLRRQESTESEPDSGPMGLNSGWSHHRRNRHPGEGQCPVQRFTEAKDLDSLFRWNDDKTLRIFLVVAYSGATGCHFPKRGKEFWQFL